MNTIQTLRYRVVDGWEQLPATFTHLDCVGVDVDSRDNVYLFTRNQPRVIVYRRDGTFLRSWGEGFFTDRTHGITIGPDDSVYCVDEGVHCLYKMTPAGELLQTIGTEGIGKKGVAGQTGYDGTLESIRGGPHFNRPTNLAIAPNGDLYVSDGYGNCKVHRFSAAGEHIQSWGNPGTGPGQFNLPHGVAVTSDGRVIVADRENDRLQFFSPTGEFLPNYGGASVSAPRCRARSRATSSAASRSSAPTARCWRGGATRAALRPTRAASSRPTTSASTPTATSTSPK